MIRKRPLRKPDQAPLFRRLDAIDAVKHQERYHAAFEQELKAMLASNARRAWPVQVDA